MTKYRPLKNQHKLYNLKGIVEKKYGSFSKWAESFGYEASLGSKWIDGRRKIPEKVLMITLGLR